MSTVTGKIFLTLEGGLQTRRSRFDSDSDLDLELN